MYKYTFIEVSQFIFKVSKHVVINLRIIKVKTKMVDIKQKECYRPNFKPWKDASKGINKQEIWHTHPKNLEILAVKVRKLVTIL